MFKKSLWYTLIVLLCINEVVQQEIPTPASFLQPRNFNYHPYELRQHLEDSKPTKQGPVLFPNDGPPPPRRPLIVTARPLIEAIQESDLNPNPPNNSLTENSIPTQNSIPNFVVTQNNPLNHVYPLPSPTDVTLSPDLLENISPISNNDLFSNPGETSVNNVPEASSYNHVPYAQMLLKARLRGYARENGFNDYEERTVLPPIYRALSDHARQNLLKHKIQKQYYQVQNLDYGNQYDSNKESDENNNEDYDQDQNYAFSYRVKDQKTGDDFSHKQQSVSGGTNGEYRVRLPDGRLQIVSYTADENGYNADVRYDEDEVNNLKNNINNDYNNANQYNNQNLQNNVKQNNNNNFIQQYNNNALRNNNANNIRQYDNQNIASNYLRPQQTNINQHEDRIFLNNYVQHDNNLKQFDNNNQNVKIIYFQQNDGNVRQYDNVNLRNDYGNYKDETPIKEDPNQYNSKEYYDYSSEYNQNYEPYNRKFAVFQPVSTPTVVTTLRPNYGEYKNFFTVAPTKVSPSYIDGVISASNSPIVKFESTSENAVFVDGKKVYTNVNHIAPTEPTSTVKNYVSVTPADYLASTIASLRDRMTVTPKPIVFGNFINTLGKYLNFK
ncbi:GATA zinc finger domain-containing protein 14-like [Maniola jurtina]|uniref:GATA zinc finger domain-containing protein 14-like n=1 Tax=Maniola jurtina TaxID=191418 RepID=UPI001E688661|nr:GATA zinc finger domain-containing protein 14-like [Maniola jurtina]